MTEITPKHVAPSRVVEVVHVAQRMLSDWNRWYGEHGQQMPVPPAGIVRAQEMLSELMSELHEAPAVNFPSPQPEADPIVGHKTFRDGESFRHEPLRRSEATAILAACDAAKAKRAADMPTDQDAARVMFQAWYRLKELGWRETCYGPTNEMVQVIEPGSAGIHQGIRWEPWPERTWWIDGDCPSNPCLYKPIAKTAGEPA